MLLHVSAHSDADAIYESAEERRMTLIDHYGRRSRLNRLHRCRVVAAKRRGAHGKALWKWDPRVGLPYPFKWPYGYYCSISNFIFYYYRLRGKRRTHGPQNGGYLCALCAVLCCVVLPRV